MVRAAVPTPPEPAQAIDLAGTTAHYVLRRTARARGLRLTADPRLGLVVSLPPETRRGWKHPNGRIEAFVRAHEGWIERQLGRLERERAEVAALGGVRDGGWIHYRGELHRIRLDAAPHHRRRSTVERIGADDDADELVLRRGARDRRPAAAILAAWFRERASEAIRRAVELHGAALGASPTAVVLRDPRSRWGSASRQGRLMFSWRLILAPPGALETVVVHELAHLRVMGHGPAFWRLVAARRADHAAQRAWLRRHSHLLHFGLDFR